MNQKNLEWIKSGLRDLGFGDMHYPDLKKTLAHGKPRASLLHRTTIDGLTMLSSIHLEKSPQSDKYRITKYDALIKKEPDHYENYVQTFYVNKNKGVTLKEAYNLLDGRAVLKSAVDRQGKPESNWLELDFRKQDRAGNYLVNKYGEAQGFDLRKSLSELPILEMKTLHGREMFIRSLEKGNLEMATITRGGVNEKIFIEANPRIKNVNLYDKDLRKLERQLLVEHQTVDQPKMAVVKAFSEKQGFSNSPNPKPHKKGLSH